MHNKCECQMYSAKVKLYCLDGSVEAVSGGGPTLLCAGSCAYDCMLLHMKGLCCTSDKNESSKFKSDKVVLKSQYNDFNECTITVHSDLSNPRII